MLPNDLGRLVQCAQPRLSPDGATVAFVVASVDLGGNRYRSAIWLAPTDGSRRPQRLTAGEDGDGNPCWSPDGRRLAFTSKRGDDDKQSVTLHVLPVDGPGEVVTLGTFREAVTDLAWSPDGRHIAFCTRTRDARYDKDDPKAQPPRRITRFFSRLDSVGWTIDRPQHVYVVSADGTEPPRNLTPGEFEHAAPAWLPSSDGLVVGGARHERRDLDYRTDLFVVGLDGGDPEPITGRTGTYGLPCVSPDGETVAFVGFDDPERQPQNSRIGVVATGGGEHRFVSEPLDRTAAPFPGAQAPAWDGDTLLFGVEDRGNVHVYRVPADASSAPTLVVGGERCITGWSHAAGALAFTATTADRPAEVFVVRDGHEQCLTDVTDPFVRHVAPRAPERFTAASSGGTHVDAWIYTPRGFDPTRSYPALLNVHGGPFTQYGNRFFDEAQLQAAAGYVVLLANPRGSSGREEAWGRAIVGPRVVPDPGTGWGSVDFDDLMAVVDEALRRYPFIDAERLGVLGGSYGGYMTSWIVGHTNRFKAACSERAVNNMLTEEWTSDIATAFRTELGVSHLDGPDEYVRISPITHVRNIETPLLIIHSEDDLRCPISQAEELFVALRLLERDVEFVRFPAESHELSRSGSPVHRVQRAEILLEFFGRHLHPAGHEPAQE
jgi:dipeptidyl aminopeptidase/acylaminoacyl peptidase